MNIHEQRFLAVLKAALRNTVIQLNDLSNDDWVQLLQLAQAHQMLPLFCQSLSPAPACVADLKSALRRQVARQTICTHAFLSTYRQLLDAGVRPLVVKGVTCRALYPQPDLRPSSDEDLLIAPEQFDATRQLLTSLGFQESGIGLELTFRHPASGLHLEIHGAAFPGHEHTYGHWNTLFEDIFDQAASLTICENTIWTPSHDDHILYLILHALKHFLHSGVGIRQVCDICLYANAYGNLIDWPKLLDRCRSLHAEQFAAALLQIGSAYLTFNPDTACLPFCWRSITVDAQPLLRDILSAGLYGDATIDRKRSSNLTLDAASGKKTSLSRTLFPNRSRLLTQYPYLQQHPYLLPIAWTQRLWRYAQSLKDNRANPSESARIGKERVALLRQYGLIG